MAKTVSIPVAGGLIGHGAAIQNVVLREPTYAEYLEFGEPTQIVFLGEGRYIVNELPTVIQEYVKVCLIEPKQPLLLEAGGMKLARAVKDSVLSFFRPDDTGIAPSPTLDTTSSGSAETGASA